MATAEAEVKEKRYLRNPKVVFVRKIDDDHFLVMDMEHKNEYQISKEVLKREYEEL
jgi:hypothetical protein